MSFQVMISQLGSGMMTTIQIFLLTLIFSLPLGLLVAFGRMSKNAVIRTITKIYISIMRGTPLMLQLLVVYFGPYYIFGVNISSSYRAYAVVIAFAINYAAYFAEIYRGGIESMPVGQYEAAEIDGAGIFKVFYKIVLPACTPILATVSIFSAVGQWNSYQDTLIYVTEQKLYSLQYLLYTYINQASSLAAMVKNSGTAAISSAALATQQTGTSIRMTVSVSGIHFA